MAEHVDQGPMVLGVSVFFIVLAITVTSLRFCSRFLAKAGFWWDDWLSLVAMVFVVVSNSTRFLFVEFGLGQHVNDVDPSKLIPFSQVLYSDMLIYGATVTLVKFSAILFYARVFPSKSLRKGLWAVAGIIAAWFIATELIVVFQCSPIAAFWDHSLGDNCIEFSTFLFAQAIPNIVTDFILLALPVSSIYHLHLAKAKRIALVIIFILGHFVAIVSIIRLILIVQSNPETHADFTFNLTDPNLWTSTELTVGLMCVCAPATGYLFRSMVKKLPISSTWKDSYGRSRSRTTPGSNPLSRAAQPSGRDASWRTLNDDDSTSQNTLRPKDSNKDSLEDIEMAVHGVQRTQTIGLQGGSR